MPGFGDVTAWDFLKGLYAVGGIKAYFDAAAVHPYARSITQLTTEPGIHHIGQTEPSAYDRAQAREAGIFWLIVAAVLAAMATTAALALSAAWRKRR